MVRGTHLEKKVFNPLCSREAHTGVVRIYACGQLLDSPPGG